MTSASRGGISSDGEMDLVVKWFSEFSEMEKSDYFKILLKKYPGSKIDTALVTSILSDLQVTEQNPTIFRCRVKLFDDWFANWSDEQKETLLTRLATADDCFMTAFKHVIDGNVFQEELIRRPVIPFKLLVADTKPNGYVGVDDEKKNGKDLVISPESPSSRKREIEEPKTIEPIESN